MGDVHDPDPTVAELTDDAEQFVDLEPGQRSRGFVHDQDVCLEGERLRDLDHLLLRHGKSRDALARIQAEVQHLEELRRLLVQGPVVQDERQVPTGLAPQEDVLGDGQVRRQIEFLVDHADAEALGGPCAGDIGRRTFDGDHAGVCPVHPGQDLHQRGLAGAVLADQGVHLTRVELEMAVHERVDAREVLGDALHLNEGLGHDGVSCGSQFDGSLPHPDRPRPK